ncbi:MAG: pilus assembly protein TadG-related protein [Kiritimatiellaeota bacterium]|nr:pilus assembly protein TadG-related protein [Kiritimatiellota bacterium]
MKRLPTGCRGRRPAWFCAHRPGQAVVFLLLAVTVLAFLLLFNIDLHRVIQRKNQAQNAGDAAALATARWQGATLNLIGELNLLHVLALAVDEPDAGAINAITNMQARLNFTGPLAALYAAQVAAKNNHIYVDPALTAFYQDHAATIRNQYASALDADGLLYYAEPWEGAWQEYASILQTICDDGIAAGPDNARFFSDPGGGHILFNKGFYEAVAGASWCWFHLYQRGLLEAYTSFHYWPPIPPMDAEDYTNSEIFGLGLHPYVSRVTDFRRVEELERHLDDARLADEGQIPLNPVSNLINRAAEVWYMYSRSEWSSWEDIKQGGDLDFPAAGEIRPQYDYTGADAVLRVTAAVDRIMPEGRRRGQRTVTASSEVTWTAAAKAFGYLEDGFTRIRPDAAAAFVLPAFRDVRLIPADTASNSDAFSSDIAWVIHLKTHLRPYIDTGATEPGCRYCAALETWEQAAFRQAGIDWLKENSNKCQLPSGGGGSRGGGTRKGH